MVLFTAFNRKSCGSEQRFNVEMTSVLITVRMPFAVNSCKRTGVTD